MNFARMRDSKAEGIAILFLSLLIYIRPLGAQVSQPGENFRPPKLRLEITSLKQIYTVGEIAFVKYTLSSMADGTLCFPVPAEEAYSSYSGYFETIATRSGHADGDIFYQHFWERSASGEQLHNAVMQRWVKLGMSEPYQPKEFSKVVVFTKAGEWKLRSTYHSPELSWAQIGIVESLGCTPSVNAVDSGEVSITVVDPKN